MGGGEGGEAEEVPLELLARVSRVHGIIPFDRETHVYSRTWQKTATISCNLGQTRTKQSERSAAIPVISETSLKQTCGGGVVGEEGVWEGKGRTGMDIGYFEEVR